MKSPTNSIKRSQPFLQNKKNMRHGGGEGAEGVLVNQEQRKVKSENEDLSVHGHVPVSMNLENDGDSFTEEFTVTKEDVSSQSLNHPGQKGQRPSPCACGEEIGSLKDAVKRLTLQVNKQSQVITVIKSSLRNAVLSLMTCCNDEEEEEGHEVQESPRRPVVEDPLWLENSDNFDIDARQEQNHENNLQDHSFVAEDSSVQMPGVSMATAVSNEDGFLVEEKTEDQVTEMDNEDVDGDDNDDSSYVPDDNESDMDAENDLDDSQGHQSKPVTASTGSGQDGSYTRAKKHGRFGCSKCGKKFTLKKSMLTHMRYVHFNEGVVFKCHLCTKVFRDQYNLLRHIESVHEGVRYQCAHCPGTFKWLKNVRRHERAVHVKGAPSTIQCQLCGMGFNLQNAINSHLSRTHYNQDAVRTNVERLQKNMERTTAMVRKVIFQCQHCPTSFPEREDLRCHLSKSHGITQGVEEVNKDATDMLV